MQKKRGEYSGNKKNNDAIVGGDTAMGTASLALGMGGAHFAHSASTAENAMHGCINDSIRSIGKGGLKGGGQVANEALADTGGSVMFIVADVLALATGLLTLLNPNKKETEEVDKLKLVMNEYEDKITHGESEVEKAQEEMEQLTQEAEKENETLRQNIQQQVADNSAGQAQLAIYNEKIQRGEGLTDSEKECYATLAEIQAEMAPNIENMETQTQSKLESINEKIGAHNETFENLALTINESQGITNQAEATGKDTKLNIGFQIAGDAANIAGGTMSGIETLIFADSGAWAFGATLWAIPFALMAFAGVALSAKDLSSQIGYLEVTNNELETSENMVKRHAVAGDNYVAGVQDMDTSIATVENIVHEVPTDTEEIPVVETLAPQSSVTADESDKPLGKHKPIEEEEKEKENKK